MPDSPPPDARRPGRPLDLSLDERVLAATRRSLTDAGWNGTTVRGIAAASGVSRPTIARRWPSKAHLVLAAILGETPDLAPFDGANREAWMRAVVDGSFELFGRPEVVAAVPGLLSELGAHADVRDRLWQSFSGAASELLTDPDGTSPDLDRSVDAQAMIAVAAGAAMFTALIVGSGQTPVISRVRELTLGLLETAYEAPRSAEGRAEPRA
jgi:AcrR family transcriptional regulator